MGMDPLFGLQQNIKTVFQGKEWNIQVSEIIMRLTLRRIYRVIRTFEFKGWGRELQPARSDGNDLKTQMWRRGFVFVETFKDGTDILIGETTHRGHDLNRSSNVCSGGVALIWYDRETVVVNRSFSTSSKRKL